MKRIEFVDSLKGLAILLVLWGHSIQYLRDGGNVSNNAVFNAIYSFHMPLFFMISGLFFKSSLKLNIKDFFYKKFIQLLLPCFVWAVLFMTYRLGVSLFTETHRFNTSQEISLLLNPFIWPFWFLKELFISYAITYISFKLTKQQWVAFALSVVFVLTMPYCAYQRFLLPFFWAGIYFKDNYNFVSKHIKYTLLASGVLFGICVLFWDNSYTIYNSKFPAVVDLKVLAHLKLPSLNFSNASISAFRLLIGLAGSIFWLTLFQTFYKKNIFYLQLEKIGTYTLGIYILQTTILEEIVNRLIDFSSTNIWVYNLLITPLVSFAVLFICLFLIILINSNRHTKFLLFGN